jgi:hypothetical protein
MEDETTLKKSLLRKTIVLGKTATFPASGCELVAMTRAFTKNLENERTSVAHYYAGGPGP